MHQVSDILNKHSREVDSAKSQAEWNVLRCLRTKGMIPNDLGLLLCLVMHHVDCDLSTEPYFNNFDAEFACYFLLSKATHMLL